MQREEGMGRMELTLPFSFHRKQVPADAQRYEATQFCSFIFLIYITLLWKLKEADTNGYR